jgi:uncharacterized hydrophobic protein (TIGR00271 family)
MNTFFLFKNLTDKDKSEAVKRLITESTPDRDFFLMVVLSVLMATFGLILDNSSVVIGSMLIAPILSPIVSFSLGLVMSDQKLISRSLRTLLSAAGLSIVASVVVSLFFSVPDILNTEILSRIKPSLAYACIAFISGFAVSFALVTPSMSVTLPGVAIAVALVPPLAVIGIGIAKFNWEVISGSLLLFLINVVGIVLASMVNFSLMNLYVKRNVAHQTIKDEDKRLEVEEND